MDNIYVNVQRYFRPSNNPSIYCRLCFMIGKGNLVALFPTDSDPQHFLIDQIREFIGIQLSPREDASDHICWRCAVALDDFQLFRQRSLEHDIVIRSANMEDIKDAEVQSTYFGNVEESDSEESIKSSKRGKLIKSTGSVESVTQTEIQTSAQTRKLDEDAYQPNQIISKTLEISNPINVENGKAEPTVKPYTCHICQIEFESKDSLFRHVMEQHSNQEIPHQSNTLYPVVFNHEEQLKLQASSHLEVQRFTCAECGDKFSSATSLWYHKKRTHPASQILTKTKRTLKSESSYKCLHCTKTFLHRQSLNTHNKSMHYDLLSYSCNLCDARFQKPTGLASHMGRYHSQVSAFEGRTTSQKADNISWHQTQDDKQSACKIRSETVDNGIGVPIEDFEIKIEFDEIDQL